MRSDFLPPKLIQGVGLAGFIALGIFWAFTARIEPMLLAFSGSLITGGNLLEVYLKLRSGNPSDPPPVSMETKADEREEAEA